ncbi:MAG: hypothetical protein ACKVI3_01315 [Verrucomicrobiia bacterium]
MPLVEVEFIGKTEVETASFTRPIADKLGEIFKSPTACTWVRVRHTPATHYAENQSGNPRGANAVFVTITLRELPDPASQAIQAREIAHALTGISGIPSAQVHLIYGPAAQGRIALGGELS